jgi:hypothetical protein
VKLKKIIFTKESKKDEKAFFDAGRSHTRRPKGAGAPKTCFFVFYI